MYLVPGIFFKIINIYYQQLDNITMTVYTSSSSTISDIITWYKKYQDCHDIMILIHELHIYYNKSNNKILFLLSKKSDHKSNKITTKSSNCPSFTYCLYFTIVCFIFYFLFYIKERFYKPKKKPESFSHSIRQNLYQKYIFSARHFRLLHQRYLSVSHYKMK